MAIKKAYQEIISYLEANTDLQVEEVLPKVIELSSAKNRGASGGKSFLADANGTVLAIHDYYFKRWMPVVGDELVEFGLKSNSATGLNVMCKLGVSLWTKQQREAKAATAALIPRLESGELDVSEIADARAEIESACNEIAHTDMGFETQEEVVDYLVENGFEPIVKDDDAE